MAYENEFEPEEGSAYLESIKQEEKPSCSPSEKEQPIKEFEWTKELVEELIWETWGHRDVRLKIDNFIKSKTEQQGHIGMAGSISD